MQRDSLAGEEEEKSKNTKNRVSEAKKTGVRQEREQEKGGVSE